MGNLQLVYLSSLNCLSMTLLLDRLGMHGVMTLCDYKEAMLKFFANCASMDFRDLIKDRY